MSISGITRVGELREGEQNKVQNANPLLDLRNTFDGRVVRFANTHTKTGCICPALRSLVARRYFCHGCARVCLWVLVDPGTSASGCLA